MLTERHVPSDSPHSLFWHHNRPHQSSHRRYHPFASTGFWYFQMASNHVMSSRAPTAEPEVTYSPALKHSRPGKVVSTKPIDLFVNQSVCLSVLGHRHYINQLLDPLQRPLISKPHPNNPWLFGPSFMMAKNLAMFMKYNYLLECTSRPFTLLKYIRSSTRLFLTMIQSIIWIISVGKS